MNVILCAQGHLPSGTSETEFEALYNSEIKPLISTLDKYPKICAAFHYSGVVLNWIERKHPEFFMLLEDLFARKQAELLGGGFYDPMLPLLPLADKIGQIEMLSTYLRKQFGKRPLGCWIPAMAWEQNLVGPLNSCGMNYTFLADEQFSGSGIKPDAAGIYAPCITEDQGKIITVFPVAMKIGMDLRKKNPFKILEHLQNLPSDEERIVVFPIGEFGTQVSPPDGNGSTGCEELFEALSDSRLNLKFSFPAKLYKSLRFLKKNYFRGVSGQNGTGIYPRQFLAKHPEAGGIYAKMIHVHTLINNQLRGDKPRKRTALEELWKAQDSGIFRLGSPSSPGLIHSPVRKAAYASLLEAERITREKSKFTPSLSVFDFDLDGEGEYVFQDEKINCCVRSRGASAFELDYLPAAWNYLDTLAPGLTNAESAGMRCAFMDYLAPAGSGVKDIGTDGIRGGRFCGAEEYEVSGIDRVQRRVTFRLPPKAGMLWGEIEIQKTWQLEKNSLMLEYLLSNSGSTDQTFVFCPSLDLSFPGEGEEFLRIVSFKDGVKEGAAHHMEDALEKTNVLEFRDIKNEAVISLGLSCDFDGRIFHVRAGLPGMEEYQSTCVMPLLPVSLESGKSWKLALSLKINS